MDYESLEAHNQGRLIIHKYADEIFEYEHFYFLLTFYSVDPFGDFHQSIVNRFASNSLNAIKVEYNDLMKYKALKSYRIDLIFCEDFKYVYSCYREVRSGVVIFS